ncbi:MAG: hypothetical protein K2J37_06250, partial [Ruminococcus sp.]|nr:hypothetical protein [Ruminococcus sp.]
YETVDEINSKIEKNNDLYDKIFKGYSVICSVYIIPCIIQLFVSMNIFALIDIITVVLVFLSGYFSYCLKSNKWCIVTGFCMMYSIAFGDDNDTFIETLIYRLGWTDFEINSLMFIPTILLMLLTIYCNQKYKDLTVQRRCYIDRYREKELIAQRIASVEKSSAAPMSRIKKYMVLIWNLLTVPRHLQTA